MDAEYCILEDAAFPSQFLESRLMVPLKDSSLKY